MSQEADLQNQSSNDALLKVASQLLEQSGINKDDFFSAISALQTAKAQNPEAKADVNTNRHRPTRTGGCCSTASRTPRTRSCWSRNCLVRSPHRTNIALHRG